MMDDSKNKGDLSEMECPTEDNTKEEETMPKRAEIDSGSINGNSSKSGRETGYDGEKSSDGEVDSSYMPLKDDDESIVSSSGGETGYDAGTSSIDEHQYPFIPKKKKKMDSDKLLEPVMDVVLGEMERIYLEEEFQDEPKEVLFSKVYSELRKKLPPKESATLSFRSAFHALLKGAPELGLKVEAREDIEDAVIFFEKKL